MIEVLQHDDGRRWMAGSAWAAMPSHSPRQEQRIIEAIVLITSTAGVSRRPAHQQCAQAGVRSAGHRAPSLPAPQSHIEARRSHCAA